MKHIYCLTIILLIFSSRGHTAIEDITGAEFLTRGIGARATGMGESFVGIYSDVTAAYWNPAGLSNIKYPELGFMHGVVMDASLEFLGFAYPMQDNSVLAFSGIFLINKPIPVTDEGGQVIGEATWLDSALTLSYGRKIKENISGGASLKIVYCTESDPIWGRTNGIAYALDCGIIYESRIEGLSFGISFLNNGTKLQMSGDPVKDDLPRTIKAGLAYQQQISNENKFMVSCDFNTPPKNDFDFNRLLEIHWYSGFGTEFSFSDTVFVRMGYYDKEGDINGLTYGFGIKFNNLKFDYSNVPATGMVGATRSNKISFAIQFQPENTVIRN